MYTRNSSKHLDQISHKWLGICIYIFFSIYKDFYMCLIILCIGYVHALSDIQTYTQKCTIVLSPKYSDKSTRSWEFIFKFFQILWPTIHYKLFCTLKDLASSKRCFFKSDLRGYTKVRTKCLPFQQIRSLLEL